MHAIFIDLGFNIPGTDVRAALHTYGLMIALGFMIGMQLAQREARRVDLGATGFDRFVQDLTFWILIWSIFISHLLFVIVEWKPEYSRNPFMLLKAVFSVWEGFVFYGGLLGGIGCSIVYAKMKGRDFFIVADTLVPSVSLGQFFGRLGCFAAGCCWGDTVDPRSTFAVQFPQDSMIYKSMRAHDLIGADATHSLHVHPVQLYESFGNLTLFFLLNLLRTQKRFNGMVLVGYLWGYSILRYIMETFRGDANRGENVLGTPFSTSQLISIVLFVAGLGIVLFQKFRKPATA